MAEANATTAADGTQVSASLPTGQRLVLLIVWLVAAVPVLLWLLQRSDPEAAVELVAVGTLWFVRIALGAGGLLLVAALLFPPVPAWLRLRWHDLRLSLTSDRGPLLRAIGELEHFASAQRHFEVGRLALLRREFAVAMPNLVAALTLAPDMAAAHHHIGLLLLRHGRLHDAAGAFARAEELDPGHAFGDALLHLGRCLDLAEQHQQAADALRKHAERHGGNRRSHYWLGLALQAARDQAGAAAAFAVAAAPPTQKLTAEENWFRALARVRRWRGARA
jgi:tetratricopeptide (TPR) repeat protein